jgi:hypothetical protein
MDKLLLSYLIMQMAEKLKKELLPKYVEVGEANFHNFLIIYAKNELIAVESGMCKGSTPELNFLNYSDQFIFLYRKEGEAIYLDLARVLRKVAHQIYRLMLKKKMTTYNMRFMNVVP